MPIPLGILAAAGFRPTAVGSYELIETITVSGSSVTSITFNNLNNYSSTYEHLQIRAAFLTNATASDYLDMRLNGVTTSSYSGHTLWGNGSTVGSNAGYGASSNRIFLGSPTSASANPLVIDLLDAYSTTKNKVVRSFTGNPNRAVELSSGQLLSTNAISSATLLMSGNSFLVNSRFSIYGLKAS